MKLSDLKKIANQIRIDIIEMLHEAKSGHPAGSLGLADIFTVLYFDTLKIQNPKDKNRDFLLISNGHVCPVLYAALANKGYFPKSELKTLRKLGSRLQGHPHIGTIPGVENSSGPLGQGISQAVGLAAALKRDKKKNRVFCIVGDGELEEGQCWEAIMFAAKEKLDNLTLIVDRNYIQIDEDTRKVMHLNPLNKKFTSFNWGCIQLDGNNMKQIKQAINHADKITDKPTCLIARTIPGKGVSFMQNDFHWHGKAPSDQEYKKAILELRSRRE